MEEFKSRHHGYAINDPGAPIGVFDSGVGGLTVAREIMRQIPNERLVYFGDTVRVPYGNKSKETVTKYSRQIVRFLQTQKVKAIVVACNTATAAAIKTLREEYPICFIGMEPAIKPAAASTRTGVIGVLARNGLRDRGSLACRVAEIEF